MLYKEIYSFSPTGKIENDIKDFLLKYNQKPTYKHFCNFQIGRAHV